MKTGHAIVVVVLLALGAARSAAADPFDGLDASAGTGGVVGVVSTTEVDGTTRQFRFGGIPFVAMVNRDMAERWSGNMQAQVLLDAVNKQMIRQGFAGTLTYHLLGGARRIVSPGEIAQTISTSRQNLSLAVRGGIFNYAATDRQDPKARLSGGVWELASGLEYRRTMSTKTALGASAMTTVVTLPASVDRLAARTVEVLGFWRTYL